MYLDGRNKKQSKPFRFNAMKVTNINTAIYWWLLAPAICLEKLETKIWGFRYYLSPPSTAICQEKLSCLNLTLKRIYVSDVLQNFIVDFSKDMAQKNKINAAVF